MFSVSKFCNLFVSKSIKLVSRTYTSNQNPFIRTWNIVSNDIQRKKRDFYPEHTDIVIIGAGFIGSAVAYAMKSRAGPGLSIVVIEKDLSHKQNQSNVVLGTLSQHFSLPENISLAQYSAEFFRNIKEHLSSDVDIQYYPCGRLILASEKYADTLEKNVTIQKEYGTKNELLSIEEIQRRYPWIDTSGIKLGCIGTEGEGVFNANIFLSALRRKSEELGVKYINAEVVGFTAEKHRDVLMEGVEPGSYEKINKLCYKSPNDESHVLSFAACIVAAGDQSVDIARMAKIGVADGLRTIPLPVGKREYNIYSIDYDYKDLPIGLNTPFVMDTSGLWFRKANLGNTLLCGHVPSLEGPIDDEEKSSIQSSLVHRVPGCKNIKINRVGKEYYDCNTYDDTGILGPHVYHGTLFFATGFGALGCQHAPGIGRAITELLIDGQFTSIDLTRFGFDRLLTDYPLIDFNIY